MAVGDVPDLVEMRTEVEERAAKGVDVVELVWLWDLGRAEDSRVVSLPVEAEGAAGEAVPERIASQPLLCEVEKE